MLASGVLTWHFHSQLKVGDWFVSALLAICLTAVTGGLCVLLIGMMFRASYRRLCRLTIPQNGDDLELDAAEAPIREERELTDTLRWFFVGDIKRQRLSLPRQLVVAVQLCPWNQVVRSTNCAVQGLLVLGSSEQGVYHRLPLLLTSDFVGAARLMRILADVLHVPYLICADADGWKAEKARARNRPPLRSGGWQS